MRRPIRERECHFWDSGFETHTLAAGQFDLQLTLRGIDVSTESIFVLSNPNCDDAPGARTILTMGGLVEPNSR